MRWEWGSESTTLICIGVPLMLSWLLALLHWAGYRKWSRAAGTVMRIAVDPNPSSDGPMFAPVVSFRTAAGATVEFTEPVYTNTQGRVGKTVAVIYPPKDPSYARIAGNVYTFQLIVGAMGAVMAAAGFSMAW